MKTKNLILLIVVAAVLGGAAWFLKRDARPASAALNGQEILPDLSLADVARIEVGDSLVLSAATDGWKVDSLYGYPADRAKIAEHVLALADLKVGQVVRGGRPLGKETRVVLKDAAGKTLASLALGDAHLRKAAGGQAAMFGGGAYPDGRYVAFKGETVLVKDALEAFDGDVRKWCTTRIASVPAADVQAVSFARGKETFDLEKDTNGVWRAKGLAANEELDATRTYALDSALSYLDFTSVADPKLTDAELGFSTGVVYTATVKSGTNVTQRVVRVGNLAPGGTSRYVKLDDGPWVYAVSTYAAENFMKSRQDLVKPKESPKTEEKK